MGLLLRVCLLLTVTTLLVEGGVLAVTRLMYGDPFAAYLAIMPGQSIDRLKDYPCRFLASKTANTQWGVCEFTPDLGLFGQITLTAYDHIIEQTYMIAQPDRLHLGDLMVCWGNPSIEYLPPYLPAGLVVRWGAEVSTNFAAAGESTKLSRFVPVQTLQIDGKWQPCYSAQ
jgi:hypothetical protein